MTDAAVIVPMLHRAHRVRPLLDSIEAATPDVRVLFVCSPDDTKVKRAIDEVGGERIDVAGPHPGDYARKINAGYRHTTEPLLFLGADDLEFHFGWLDAAMAQLDDGIGVVGTNDLGSQRVMRGEHATHSLVTRAYADEFGTIDAPGQILHEGYDHCFCDDELVATARKRGAWAFAADSHVEHLHPSWGKAQSDDVYVKGMAKFGADRRLFRQRGSLWT